MSRARTFGVCVETDFLAWHRLGPAGECIELHRHDWRVTVDAGSDELDRIAIVVDFRKLRADTDALLDELRDGTIEDHPDFASVPTTAAAVAEWVLGRLQRSYRDKPYRVVSVEVGCDPGISFSAGD